ncbi:S1C family serine protease [Lapillicoccus jejuensis]|nr:trypsin-like peptidase domain-containing protein [Lapillicoccus jejuensis]
MARLIAPPPPPGEPRAPGHDGPATARPSGTRPALPPPGTPGRLMTPPPQAAPPPSRPERLRSRAASARAAARRAPARAVSTARRTATRSAGVVRGLSRRALVAAVVALVLLVAGGAWLATRPPAPAPVTAADVSAAITAAQQAQASAEAAAPPDAGVAWSTIQPSLVLITATRPEGRGTGAGVVVNADGTILTAAHVVEGATSVRVAWVDGTTSAARVTKADTATDTATLLPATLPQPLVPATLGGGVRVGDPVFAVGHPLGLADSLSAGVVSALDRSVRVEGDRTLAHLIQTDAAVNPGNSGGPLLDRAGHVVGIVTGLANPSGEGAFSGIGFAVPIATAGGTAGSPPQ